MAAMKKVCGWCGKVLRQGDPDSEDVTHGICPVCLAAWRADAMRTIEAQQRQEGK